MVGVTSGCWSASRSAGLVGVSVAVIVGVLVKVLVGVLVTVAVEDAVGVRVGVRVTVGVGCVAVGPTRVTRIEPLAPVTGLRFSAHRGPGRSWLEPVSG